MCADQELLTRSTANPLLTAEQWPIRINTVFNPGATIVDGETVVLARVEDRRGVSQLTVARSADGVTDWRIDKEPLIRDDPSDPTMCWGAEDPRITRIDELGGWVIAFTGYGPEGPCVRLAVTTDFVTVEHYGPVLPPEDKNASLLPRRVNGKFIIFHRPYSGRSGRADVWLSRSDDLRAWSQPEPVMTARIGGWWDSTRIGIGPPPIETPEGWLVIYHGVKQMVNVGIYRVGVALLDLDDPSRTVRRSDDWLLSPSADYEVRGDVPNVIFPTGLVCDQAADELRLYYGAADTCVAMASGSFSALVRHLVEECPQPPPLDVIHPPSI